MKIAILGDSISEGIGSKKVNYCDFLQELMPQCKIYNFALTGTTIKYGLEIKDKIIEYNPDVVVIFYGNVDALPRMKENCRAYKYIPNRYKGLGMSDPRALYTRKKPKMYFQYIDSFIRYNLKNLIIKLYGYTQWTTLNEFESYYDELLKGIMKENRKIILLTNVPIDEKFFPNSNYEYNRYNAVIHEKGKKYKLDIIDIYNQLSIYKQEDIFLKDKYHPNKKGYKIIAELIYNKLK